MPKNLKRVSRPRTTLTYCDLDAEAVNRQRVNEAPKCRARTMRRRRTPTPPVLTDLDFIRANVTHSGDACLLLPFSDHRQPAKVSLDGVSMAAARAMCILAHGDPRPGDQARHLCGNGHLSCVNPSHLAWGTSQQNANDLRLHTGRPVSAPLAPEVLAEVKAAKGHPNVIAVKFNVPTALVEMLRR
jgi:hypothetical protein